MTIAEMFARAEYPVIVAGERLPQEYEAADIVTLAEAIGADILTAGDVSEILPDEATTPDYLDQVLIQCNEDDAAGGYGLTRNHGRSFYDEEGL